MWVDRRILSKEEKEISKNLQELSNLAQNAVKTAMEALQNFDSELCEKIKANDKNINALQQKIENTCLSTIATQQPVATDLRVLVSGIHISVELERIADHAVGIAKTIQKMPKGKSLTVIDDLLSMATRCESMMQRATQAYLEHNPALAKEVAAEDLELDNIQTRLTNEIIEQMCSNPDITPLGTYLTWIIHNVERVGDRVTNICEQVVYIEKGQVVDLNA